MHTRPGDCTFSRYCFLWLFFMCNILKCCLYSCHNESLMGIRSRTVSSPWILIGACQWEIARIEDGSSFGWFQFISNANPGLARCPEAADLVSSTTVKITSTKWICFLNLKNSNGTSSPKWVSHAKALLKIDQKDLRGFVSLCLKLCLAKPTACSENRNGTVCQR